MHAAYARLSRLLCIGLVPGLPCAGVVRSFLTPPSRLTRYAGGMTRILLLVVSLSFSLAACGPEEEPAPSPFIGRWLGTATISDGSSAPLTYNAALAIEEFNADFLTVREVCPDGSGFVRVRVGETLSWSAPVTCPYPPGPLCSTSTITYTNAKAELSEGGTLLVTGQAVIEGCGYSVPVGVAFYGRK